LKSYLSTFKRKIGCLMSLEGWM